MKTDNKINAVYYNPLLIDVTLRKGERLPSDVVESACRNFKFTPRDKLLKMMDNFVSLNNGKVLSVFEIMHELFGYLRKTIEINRVKYRNKYDGGRFD